MTNQKMTPAEGLIRFINDIPLDYNLYPPELYPPLLEAAAHVESGGQAEVILALLGVGGSYGMATPSDPMKFPEDHRLHLDMGMEWYWLACNLEVEGSDGLDKIGVLLNFTRMRAVSLKVQQEAGWTDEEAQIVDCAGSVTVATRKDSLIVRRSPNTKWGAFGDKINFGADPFLYQVGGDYLKGSKDVLPLKVHIDDGSNMRIDLTVTSELPAEKAFFLQGKNGIMPKETLGTYYSYPQLQIKGTVSVGGVSYRVKGLGWLDHQIMMSSTDKQQLPKPRMPGWHEIIPSNGWSWCGFNFKNGDAFTASAFQKGAMRVHLPVKSGIYLRRAENGWERIDVSGTLDIDQFIPGLEHVLIPTAWTYRVSDMLAADWDEKLKSVRADLELLPVPWYPDGTFQGGTLEIYSETPVNVAVIDRAPQNGQFGVGKTITGSGYCESVDYEPFEKYVERCLAYLKVGSL